MWLSREVMGVEEGGVAGPLEEEEGEVEPQEAVEEEVRDDSDSCQILSGLLGWVGMHAVRSSW